MTRTRASLTSLLKGKSVIFCDGAMGTMLQESGVGGHACPEELNLSHPRLIQGIHAAYVRAGARIIETNTFGANRRKLAKAGLADRLPAVIQAGVAAARRAAGDLALVAGSVGPLGEFIEPVGSLSPREAREIFTEAALLLRRAGVDLLLIETMSDIKEMRAACLAAKDAGLPFAVSMTFEDDGRTVLGTPPEAAVITAEALGASLVGANCSSGPAGLVPVLRRMAMVARVPLIAQPNAGMPVLRDGRTHFPTGPGEFAAGMEEFLSAGVRVLGGCCGTTPDHIDSMARRLKQRRPAVTEPLPGCRLASRTGFTLVGAPYPVAIIGERVNPTGRKQLAAEILAGSLATVREEILGQVRSGAALLDLNAGVPGADEAAVLTRILELAQRLVPVPLVLDSTNPRALETALEAAEGRVLINSVNATRKSLDVILPLAARHGAAVIGLAMDERGIPPDAATRLRLARRIIRAAAGHGLSPDDILIDCLAMAAGSDQHQVGETLRAIQALRSQLGVGSVLGISNVSYGLPAREELNVSFLAMAVFAGLDAAIVNPYSTRLLDALAASQVLSGRDAGAAAFIALQAGRAAPDSVRPAGKGTVRKIDPRAQMTEAVLQGDGPRLTQLVTASLDAGTAPMSLNEEVLIPALEKVGELFERKAFFLPQVIASAEAVRAAFSVIKARLPKRSGATGNRLLLATVEGDIHDLGKNILRSLLENYGFEVIDLGINVAPRTILARVRKGDIRLVCLSALMTTTLPALEATLRLLRKDAPAVPVVVGGAVLTAEYARSIGADGYAADASRGVKLIRGLLAKQ